LTIVVACDAFTPGVSQRVPKAQPRFLLRLDVFYVEPLRDGPQGPARRSVASAA
jgi:hypothetical protein